jgi:hypothetical protein
MPLAILIPRTLPRILSMLFLATRLIFAFTLLPAPTVLRGCLGIGGRLLQLCPLLLFQLLRLLQLLLRAGLLSCQRGQLAVHARIVFRLLKQVRDARQAAACSLRFLGPLPLRFSQGTLVSSLGRLTSLGRAFGLPFGLAELGSVAAQRVLALLLQGLQRILAHCASLAHFQ